VVYHKTIDCIISDESMNYMNGSQTAELVYKFITNHKNLNIPFYLLTAYSNENIYADKISRKT
jgi:CheY-like chemotaxis protein